LRSRLEASAEDKQHKSKRLRACVHGKTKVTKHKPGQQYTANRTQTYAEDLDAADEVTSAKYQEKTGTG